MINYSPLSTTCTLTVGGTATFDSSINMSDNQPINYGGQTMFTHTGSITKIGDNSSSSVLSISGGNATFEGTITSADDVEIRSGNKLILQRPNNAVATEISTDVNGTMILNSVNDEGFKLQNAGTTILEIGNLNPTGANFAGDITVSGTNGVTSTKFKLNNNWQIQPAGSAYAKFTNWVNLEGTGFYTSSDIYMDLDDSSSRFVVRGIGNTEIFVINTAASNAASFTGLVSGITPVAAANFVTKAYADGLTPGAGVFLPLAGGTMTGNIVMGDNDITGIDQLTFTSGTFLTDVSSNYVNLHYASSAEGGIYISNSNGTQGYLYADGGATSQFGLLTGAGSWAVRTVEQGLVELRYNNFVKFATTSTGVSVTGNVDVNLGEVQMTDGYSIQWGGNAILNHSGSATTIGDNSSSTVLTLANGDATFAGDITVSGGDITLGGTGRIQGVDTVSASTDAANKAYVDSNFAQRYSFDIGSSAGLRRYI